MSKFPHHLTVCLPYLQLLTGAAEAGETTLFFCKVQRSSGGCYVTLSPYLALHFVHRMCMTVNRRPRDQ